ncbi:MAG: DNA polymerase domain-containing protein, partial [Alphaproteobacteria bacterium]
FQKDAPGFAPDWVRRVNIYSRDSQRDIRYIVIDEVETLLYVVNLAAIPLHLWSSRIGSLESPDWLVLDLDPKEAPFGDVVKVARLLHGILSEIGVESFIKTSGASGLHILLPLGRRYTHEQAKDFARLLATLAADSAPEIATVARPVAERGGRVYIDFGQNGQGVTIAAPFTVRPLPGAPVSCPLRWREVNSRLSPSRFTIKTVLARFARGGDPMAPVLKKQLDIGAALAQIEKKFSSLLGKGTG